VRTHRNFASPGRIAVGSTPGTTPGAATRRAGLGVAAVALALTLVGCQSLGNAPGDDPPDDPIPSGSPDADAVLLQIEVSGGFVMMGYDFSRVPELTVYADGRAIVQGPQIAIYPGPALPNLQVEQLSEADVAALVAAARDAGLLAEAPSYGQPWITDVPTTFVRLTVDGRTYEHAAYALGFFEGEAPADGVAPPAEESGITEAERVARVALAEFIATAHDLVGATGDGEAYQIDAFGIFAQSVTFDAEGAVGGLAAQVLPWPLDVSLADAAECTVVDGDAAQTLLRALADANSATLFEQDGVTYSVWFRPLLPHESGCAGLG